MSTTNSNQGDSADERRVDRNRFWWEGWGVVVILSVYCVIQLNNIKRGVFVGQDFGLHEYETHHLMENPSEWFTTNFTNRPLLYWIGELCSKLGDEEFTYQRSALVFVILSVTALGFLYASSRRFIKSVGLRLAALAFISFLPATIIPAVVYAADTVSLLPFAVSCWALGRALTCDRIGERLRFSGVAGVALSIGQLTKFTFLFTPIGAFAAVSLHWYVQRIRPRAALPMICLISVLPLGLGIVVYFKAKAAVENLPKVIHFEPKGTGEMSWRSLLLIKYSDREILNAPTYWNLEKFEGRARQMLLVPNGYSYAALMHLGIFTDVLNLAVGGWNDARNGRPVPQQAFSILAVRLGLLFSLLALAGLLSLGWQIAEATIGRTNLPNAAIVAWGCLASAWFLPLAAVLPFVHDSYGQGYWLPRLIVPALWGAALVLFFYLDKIF